MMNGNVSLPQRSSQHHTAPLQGTQTPNIAQMRRGGNVNMSTGPTSPVASRAGNNNILPSDFGAQQHNPGFSYNAGARGPQGMNQGVSVPGMNGNMGHVPMGGQPQNPNLPSTQLSTQIRTNSAGIANAIPAPQKPTRTGIRVPSQIGANPALMGVAVGNPPIDGTTVRAGPNATTSMVKPSQFSGNK